MRFSIATGQHICLNLDLGSRLVNENHDEYWMGNISFFPVNGSETNEQSKQDEWRDCFFLFFQTKL